MWREYLNEEHPRCMKRKYSTLNGYSGQNHSGLADTMVHMEIWRCSPQLWGSGHLIVQHFIPFSCSHMMGWLLLFDYSLYCKYCVMCHYLTLLRYLSMHAHAHNVCYTLPLVVWRGEKELILARSNSFFHTFASELTLTLFHILESQLRDEWNCMLQTHTFMLCSRSHLAPRCNSQLVVSILTFCPPEHIGA